MVPGLWVENELGRCYLSTVRRPGSETHGCERLDAALESDTGALARLARDGRAADVDLRRTAFVDTETTGLAGGAGTYAFLIGVGVFDGPSFKVGQFFMDDPSQERAQLAEVAAWLEGCTAIVTFNGRTFDIPLLNTRYRLHGREMPLSGAPHIDLLPISRRLWRRRLSSCSLGSIEEHVLEVGRADDVPGALIPPRYFSYQRDGDARPLAPVFKHNAVDILSMVSLISLVSRAYGNPNAALEHGQDWLSLARVFAAEGDLERAREACETALSSGLAGGECEEARMCLSFTAKRQGDWVKAVAQWQVLASEPRRLYPFEELAKYYEHRAATKDFAAAIEWAALGRRLVASGAIKPRRGRGRALVELDHRLARLERRLAAAGGD